jgi:hypothetical protein
MALASVEKVFRLWRNQGSSEISRILVDRKVDSFLQKHFVEYSIMLPQTEDSRENPGYRYYIGVKEDDQYDDLTLLGIRRK